MAKPVLPPPRSGCPIGIALDLFGDRWSLLIVRDLLFGGPRSYTQLAEGGEGIASNILSERLARLEAGGIIERRQDENDRRRVNYRLTAKGIDLAPVLVDMVVWAARHEETAAPPKTVRRFEREREEVLAELRRKWLDES
jgi:DNA-binding HxlR family transcriptional regulator